MMQALWRGLRLRCPNCGSATVSSGLFHVEKICTSCRVRFERKSGESAGASIIWLSVLPILALMIFFAMYLINPALSLWVLLGVPLLFVVVVGVIGYRHIKGLWIGIAYLTGGVYADKDDVTTH